MHCSIFLTRRMKIFTAEAYFSYLTLLIYPPPMNMVYHVIICPAFQERLRTVQQDRVIKAGTAHHTVLEIEALPEDMVEIEVIFKQYLISYQK